MKKWVAIQLILVLLVVVVGQICKLQFKNNGLLDLKSIKDTYALESGIGFIFGDNANIGDTEEWFYENLKKYEEVYISGVDESEIIIIGEPTGKIENYSRSLGQEMVVKQVLRGANIKEGDTIFVYSVVHFGLNNEDKVVYTGLKNLMNKGNEYLVFMDTSGIEHKTLQYTYALSTGSPFFSYLNLTGDFSYPITKSIEDIRYAELAETEFFASSQRMVDQLNVIKHKIIKKYVVDPI